MKRGGGRDEKRGGGGRCAVVVSNPPHSPPHPALIRFQSPQDGQTALHKAVVANRSENVHILLSADPRGANIQDKAGNTPLHLACQHGHKRCLRVILVHDHTPHDINYTPRNVTTPLVT